MPIGYGRLTKMNSEAIIRIGHIQEDIDDILNMMRDDPYFACPKFNLEKMWNDLQNIILISIASEEV